MRGPVEDTADGEFVNDVVLEIVTAVADAENTNPVELTPPLGEVVPTEALESLLESAEPGVFVKFPYRRWEIEARSGGGVELRELPNPG